MYEILSPKHIAATLSQLWSPQLIGETDDSCVKVARIQGTLGWHNHTDEDKIFFILQGALRIEMPDRVIELTEGEMFVVPKNIEHQPVAEDECLLMFIERKPSAH